MSIGELIRKYREQAGLTQDHLAAQVGISKPYLSNIETGRIKNPPSDGVLKSIEKALGFPSDELLRLAHLARTPLDVRHERELLETELAKLRGVLKEFLSRSEGLPGGPSGVGSLAASLQCQANIKSPSAGGAIPLINKVTEGYPLHFNDLDYPSSIADEYVRCVDVHDSQAFAVRVVGDSMEPRYRHGDIVVFSPNTTAQSGDDCFVRLEGGATAFKRCYRDDDATLRLQPLDSEYPAEVLAREKVTGLWPAIIRIERLR